MKWYYCPLHLLYDLFYCYIAQFFQPSRVVPLKSEAYQGHYLGLESEIAVIIDPPSVWSAKNWVYLSLDYDIIVMIPFLYDTSGIFANIILLLNS